jgi:hypothetical protein
MDPKGSMMIAHWIPVFLMLIIWEVDGLGQKTTALMKVIHPQRRKA